MKWFPVTVENAIPARNDSGITQRPARHLHDAVAGGPATAGAAMRASHYCVFFASFAMMSGAVMVTPQGGNSLAVKKLSVRFDQ